MNRNKPFHDRNKLLSRDDFREGVFARDNYKCVVCNDPAVDAHHIIERRLFNDGGYYINNGASVCEPCHIECEKTNISPEDLRAKIGISDIIVPEDMYQDQPYDKWGNPYFTNGKRGIGPLFFDESVQKIIKQHIDNGEFTHYVKYPRTYHLPWSQSVNDDDRMLKSMDNFIGNEVVVTEKLDGENTNIYKDYIHARSLDGRHHVTRNWVKSFAAQWQHDIPDYWRICGENMYATHSIRYTDLDSYFYAFSIWNDKNDCLSWDDTIEWCNLLGLKTPKVLYRGLYDETTIKGLWKDDMASYSEGYVIRVTRQFNFFEFKSCVSKFVRKNHVQTNKHHWQFQKIIPNTLRKS